ncbi:MAG: hypothetical protein M3Y28_03970, partial [Armatimonadota bacterium]|nr:hypothetical protein [Armatimonadota bacterium]
AGPPAGTAGLVAGPVLPPAVGFWLEGAPGAVSIIGGGGLGGSAAWATVAAPAGHNSKAQVQSACARPDGRRLLV